ncbi:hypothetical protein [Mycobacterium cookii]|nr:hypothetical protein [Mycobacterium cookii]
MATADDDDAGETGVEEWRKWLPPTTMTPVKPALRSGANEYR